MCRAQCGVVTGVSVAQVVCIMGAPATMGVGKVSRLDDPSAVGTDRERKVLRPDSAFYAALADDCCQAQVTGGQRRVTTAS